jgi:formylglycine-generating enzyme required for sulfatase activity
MRNSGSPKIKNGHLFLMKTPKIIHCFLALGLAVVFSRTNVVFGQTQPALGIQLYPGLTITGAVGSVYSIQETTNVAQSGGWDTVAVVQLPNTNYVWFDAAASVNQQRFYRTVTFTNVLTNMVFIPAGTFTMGSPATEATRVSDEVQHVVTISKGFFMGKYLVTQTNYVSVVGGSNPSFFSPNNPNNPVEQVTWFNATNYCALRTAQEQAAGKIPTNWGYRLPTESEWEYACRAGTTAAFYLGSGLHSGQANFVGTNEYDSVVGNIYNAGGVYLQTTTPVGNYSANGWGLYDMAGNVFEWCQDWYGAYPTDQVADPQGAATGSFRVNRGGGWASFGNSCRSALRSRITPTLATRWDGFRVVLAPTQ